MAARALNQPFSVRPSTRGLANINFEQHSRDFEFRVGGRSHSCSSFVAEFLSPKISQLRAADLTIDSFQVCAEDKSGMFEQVLSLGRGDELVVNQSNQDFLIEVFKQLRNSELYFMTSGDLDSGLTVTNVADQLKMKRSLNANVSNELDFIASNFHKFPRDSLESLDPSDLYQVLSSRNLLISSEDSLCEIVMKFVEADPCFFSYFEFVRFEFLSRSMISSFVELTKTLDSNGELGQWLSGSIWSSICNRFVLTPESSCLSDRVVKPRCCEFRLQQSSPLSGIISHLTSKHGGNVHDRGIVAVTASSCNGSSYLAKYAVDMNETATFGSVNSPNQWLCYDFKTLRIIPTAYSIRSLHQNWGATHCVRSWVIESSDDGTTWRELDRQDNNTGLKDGSVKSFQISKGQECCFIRIRQTGPTENSYYYLVVCCWELFGSLVEPAKQ
jgi:hypothetical protein